MIAAFGLPGETAGRDFSDAVAAGKRMQEELSFRRGWATTVGVSGGECIAGPVGKPGVRQEYSATGPPANLAARLCHRASATMPGKGVLVDQNCKAACGDSFATFEHVSLRHVKGFTDPLDAYYVTELNETSRPAEIERWSESDYTAEDVRADEKKKIETAMSEAKQNSRIVLVQGEQMSGKGILLNWTISFAQNMNEHVDCFVVDSKSTASQYPFASLQRSFSFIKQLRNVCSGEQCDTYRVLWKLERAREQGIIPPPSGVSSEAVSICNSSYLNSTLHAIVHDVLGNKRRDCGQMVARVVVGTLIRTLAAELGNKALVLVAKSTDLLSWDALQAAVSQDKQVCVIARADEHSLTMSLAPSKIVRLFLKPLTEQQVETAIRSKLGVRHTVQGQLVRYIHTASEGSPELVDDILDRLLDEGVVLVDRDNKKAVFKGGKLRSKFGGISPHSALSLAQSSLDKLDVLALQIVKVASALLGPSFTEEEVLQIARKDSSTAITSAQHVLNGLVELEARELVVQQQKRADSDSDSSTKLSSETREYDSEHSLSSPVPKTTSSCSGVTPSHSSPKSPTEPEMQRGWEFKSRLFQNATYLTIPQKSRQSLHRSIAYAYIDMHGTESVNILTVIAQHLRLSNLEEEAAPLLSRAAFGCYTLNAQYEASINAARAAPLTQSVTERLKLHVLRAECLYELQQFSDALTVSEEALHIASESSQSEACSEALACAAAVQAKVYYIASRISSACDSLARAGSTTGSLLARLCSAARDAMLVFHSKRSQPRDGLLRTNNNKCCVGQSGALCLRQCTSSSRMYTAVLPEQADQGLVSADFMKPSEAFLRLVVGCYMYGQLQNDSATSWLSAASDLAVSDREIASQAHLSLAVVMVLKEKDPSAASRIMNMLEESKQAEDVVPSRQFFARAGRAILALRNGMVGSAIETLRSAMQIFDGSSGTAPVERNGQVLFHALLAVVFAYSSDATEQERARQSVEEFIARIGTAHTAVFGFNSFVLDLLASSCVRMLAQGNNGILETCETLLKLKEQLHAAQPAFNPTSIIFKTILHAFNGKDSLQNAHTRAMHAIEQVSNSGVRPIRLRHSWAEALDALGERAKAAELWHKNARAMIESSRQNLILEWVLLPESVRQHFEDQASP